MTRASGLRGFTLVEVLVAASVMTLGLLMVLAAMVANTRSASSAVDTRLATQALRNRLEGLDRQVSSLTAANIAAFLSQGPTAIPGCAVQADGTPAQVTVTFLTEAQAQAFWNSSEGIDLDQDGVVNETDAPPTTGKLWHAYAVRFTARYGDRTAARKDAGGVVIPETRTIEVTTMLVDKDG